MSPITTVFIYFPLQAFVTIALMICISGLVYRFLNEKHKKKILTKQIKSAWWLLITYSEILLYLTALGRRSLDYYRYNFDLGYSYQEVFVLGDYTLASQILINIFMFIPIGFLCYFVITKKVLVNSMLYGGFLSFIIEVLQLVLRRGYCEFDDLISNLLGTLIGCVLAVGYKKILKVINEKRN